MSPRCIGEPVSWLRLERHHLGEGAAGERDAIASHLAACPVCMACLAAIEAGDGRELPPLTLPAVVARRRPARRWAAVAGLAGFAAAAVLVLVVVRPRPRPGEEPEFGGTPGTKGGQRVLAFTLVDDEGAPTVDTSGLFRDGARFRALVTCSPGSSASLDLVVLDDGGASFPLAPARAFACGNDVPLPGAFRLTGRAHETVCLAWSVEGDVDRATLARGAGATSPGRPMLCKDLEPAP